MEGNGQKWPNWPKWPKMAQNAPKCSKMVKNDKKSANCQKLLTKLVKGWAWLKLQKIPQYYYNRPNLLSERARGWLYVTTPWSFLEWWAWGERQPSPGCFRREREVEGQHWRSSGSSQRPGQPLGPSQKEGPEEGKRWLPSDCLQKEVSTPWPFPKGGDREGKAVTTPGEDQERDNPWALPKEKAKGGHTETTTLVGSFWRERPREGKQGRPSSPSQQQGPWEGEWWFLQFFPWSTAQFTGLCFWVSKPLCLIQPTKQNLHGRPRSHSYDKWIGYVFCHVTSCLFLVPFCH